MSNDTLDFVDCIRVMALQRKGRFGHIALIVSAVAVTLVLWGVSTWLGV